MAKYFNVAGPCDPLMHYMLPPLRRAPQLSGLIDQQLYFVLHAPRQVGKTTTLRTLAQELTASGRYVALLVSMEVGAPFPQDPAEAILSILDAWRGSALRWLPPELQPPPWPETSSGRRLGAALAAWARVAPRPLVLFLDEIDALYGETLLSVLRQLRDGASNRPSGFPWSLALCGMRDVRDYKLLSGGQDRLHSSSPFNIKADSFTLRDFNAAEVTELLLLHTADTGQPFTPQALSRVFELTCGQPWLVNALARQLTEVVVPEQQQTVDVVHVEQAREILIQRRDTHLDSLAERLREPRVRRIIQPILIGASLMIDVMNDDVAYVRDLGLVAPTNPLRIANPIYQEVIPRALNFVLQASLVEETAWYQRPDGTLDMVLVLAAFLEFFAENSEAWLKRFDYAEAGPHLMLMAFLQRVVNGGGRITREFALGSGRADLVVHFAERRHAIELKLRRGPKTKDEGVAQLSAYLDRLGEAEGFLVVFDRRKGISWSQRLSISEVAGPGGQRIYCFGA